MAEELSPFQRGEQSRRRGDQSPGPVLPGMQWSDRLFRRGYWSADECMRLERKAATPNGDAT